MMGLVLGNDEHIARFVRLTLDPKEFAETRRYMTRFQSELSFLIRAFFFVFLGIPFNPAADTILFSLFFGRLFVGINLVLRYVAVVAATVRSPMAVDRVPMTLLCGQGPPHAPLAGLPPPPFPPGAGMRPTPPP